MEGMHKQRFHLQAACVMAFAALTVLGVMRMQQPSSAFSCSGFGEDDSLIYEENCYLMFGTGATRAAAATACTGVGGHLAVITDADENAAVAAILTGTGWINGTNVTGAAGTQSGSWLWSTGEPTTYEAWGPTEPDDGDGVEDGGENCIVLRTDGDWYDLACTATPTVDSYLCECDGACNSVCGNSTIDEDETCDDGDATAGDGCSASCLVESGWTCSGAEPSVCQLCGNGIIEGTEVCDDDNIESLDGCNGTCTAVETGWSCDNDTPPSVCTSTCGDGVLAVGGEFCDDGGTDAGDSCSATCTNECGDGAIDADPSDAMSYVETCDDGNAIPSDGCSEICRVEAGNGCEGSPSNCFINTGGNSMKFNTQTGNYDRKELRTKPAPISKAKAFEHYEKLFATQLAPTVVELILSRVDWPVCGGRSRRAPVFPSKVIADAERGTVMARIAGKLCVSPSNNPVPYRDFDPREPYAQPVRALWNIGLNLGSFSADGTIQESLKPNEPMTFLELTSLITQLRLRGYIDWRTGEEEGE